MKQTNNFAEIAEMFNAIAKAEKVAGVFNEASDRYEEASDRAFGKSVYSEETKVMLLAYEERRKAEKAYRRVAEKVVEAMGLSADNYDEQRIVRASKYASQSRSFLYEAKHRILMMMKRVEI